MTTLLLHHDSSALHDTGQGHPERPARIQAVMAALSEAPFAGLDRREAPAALSGLGTRVTPAVRDMLTRMLTER